MANYPHSRPDALLRNGKFSEGDPAAGIPAGVIPADWANALTDELLNVIKAAGITPDEFTYDQLLTAIKALIQIVQDRLDAHKQTANAHSVTTGQIGAATKQEHDNHAKNTSNPHGVTCAQIGALTEAEIIALLNQSKAKTYYADVYSRGHTTVSTARSWADAMLNQTDGDMVVVRWQEQYSYGTGNATATSYRVKYTFWIISGGQWLFGWTTQ